MAEIEEKYQTPAHKVRAFLASELAMEEKKINLTSRLRQDLGIDGADAAEILEAYSLMFDVDIEAFRINDYFGPEAGINPVLSLMMWVFGNSRPLKTLTVADLVMALDKRILR